MRAGKVRHVGVSNETAYGVMRFCEAARQYGLPKIVSIQNSYSLLVRGFEGDLAEVRREERKKERSFACVLPSVPQPLRAQKALPAARRHHKYSRPWPPVPFLQVCAPRQCNVGLLAYSPLAGGSLSGKYVTSDPAALSNARFNLFPGARWARSCATIMAARCMPERRRRQMLSRTAV